MKSKLIKYIFFALTLSISILVFTGCYEHFPLDQDVARTQNSFFDQDSIAVNFPEMTEGKITLLAMVYTHCPDICPMTTHNMRLVEQKLSDDLKNHIKFIVISFDPDRDIPSVLKKYAELRDYNFNTWSLLSGDKQQTKEVMLKFDVKAIFTDSTYVDGELSYNVMHTDRISLIDQNGRLRKNYKGSVADIEEIVEDINYLTK